MPDSSWIPSVPSISGWVPSIVRPLPVVESAPAPVEPSPVVAATAPATEVASFVPLEPVADPLFSHTIPSYFSPDLIPTAALDLSSLAASYGLHPIMRIQSLFLNLHESFPVLGYTPWAILIPLVTILLRSALFPFAIRAQQNAGRMARIQPEMLKGMAKVKAAKASGDVMREQMATMEVGPLSSCWREWQRADEARPGQDAHECQQRAPDPQHCLPRRPGRTDRKSTV